MKKFSKVLLLTMLTVILVFNTCGIVLADTNATITVTEETVNAETGVKKLVFTATTPAGSAGVNLTSVIFSWDNTVIQPVSRTTGNADVNFTATSNNATKTPFKVPYSDPDEIVNISMPAVKVVVGTTRTAAKIDSNADDTTGVSAIGGIDIAEFYYKVKDGKTTNSETFKIETEYTDGSILKEMCPDDETAAAIKLNTSSTYFKYATPADDTENISKPTLTYTGSDILVLGSLEIGALTISEVTVPTVYENGVATGNEAKTVALTATAKSTIDTDMPVPADAVWAFEEAAPEGVTISGAGASATLTVAPGAGAGTAKVKVTAEGKSDVVEVAITRASTPVVETAMTIKVGDTPIVNDECTVVKPATEATSPKTVTFSEVVYDQYGATIGSNAVYAITGGTCADCEIEGKVLSVPYGAIDGTVVITATHGSLQKSFTVNIVGLEVNWNEVTVAETITYGATNASAVTLPAGGAGTATVDGETVNGVYTVEDATDVQDAGDATITVIFKANSDEGDYANVVIEKTYDITINKADYDMTRISAAPQTSTYVGSAIDYADTNVSKPDDVIILDKVYSASPVNVGEYTVTISFETTDANYNNPTDVTVTLTINKAVATSFKTEAITGSSNARELAVDFEVTDMASFKEYLELPTTAEVNFGTGLVAEVAMTWADPTNEWNPKGGTYVFVGTPSNNNLDLGTLTLTCTDTVTPVNGVLTEGLNNITVAAAALAAADGYDDIKFPTSIEVTYGDDTSSTVIDSLTWTKTLDELKAVAVGSNVTVGLAADTFPVWATITNANDFTFSVTDKLPVDIEITMATAGVYGTAMEAATADQVDAGDGIDESGTEDIDIVYTGTTKNGVEYNSRVVPTEAGSYTATATLVSSTHAGSATADFTIAPKAIAVTVDDATKKYSDANPTFAIVEPVDGLVGEDDLNVTFSTTATETTPVGTAPITAVAGNKNYNVTWTDGTLTIEPKPLSETTFVPVISGPTDRGSALSFTVAGLAADQYDAAWNGTTNGILGWADSNSSVTVTITGKGNYTGTKTSEGYVIPKYELGGSISYTNDNGGEDDAKIDVGDTITIDLTDILPGSYVFDEMGASATYTWYLDDVVIEGATADNYIIVLGDAGVLSAKLTVGDAFTGEFTVTVGEINKTPLAGAITLAEEAGVVSITANTVSGTEGTDYDLIWTIDGTDITEAVEAGAYTIVAGDYGKTITVKAVAKGETYTGEIVATEVVDPIAPSNVTIAATASATSITATVTAVENGAAISGYTIVIKDGETTVETYTGAENSYTFEGLTTGTTYTIEATATNAAGTSEIATVTASPFVATSSSRPRPSTPTTPTTPTTPDEGEGEGEGTTTPDKEVEVKVEDTSAKVDADVIKDNETVAVSTETESGTEVKTTVNVADANVASLEVSTKDSDKVAAGAAAEGAVGTPVEVTVDAKDAEGNKADVTVDVAIPSEEKAYAYIIDENGVATRTDSVYNEETGEVEVANVPDGAVVMLSTTAPATFDDSAEHWAEDTINYAVDAGIMNGVGGSTFDPDGKATRGMVNAMMVRLAKVAGVELAEATDDHKVDTDAAHWAAATDLIALANGWSTGVRTLEDGTVVMDTDASVTREQLVTLLWRFVEHPEAEGDITTFDDHHETSDWAKEAKAWAVGAGIINGKPGNVLDPDGTATRAEIATMFQRLMNYMTK